MRHNQYSGTNPAGLLTNQAQILGDEDDFDSARRAPVNSTRRPSTHHSARSSSVRPKRKASGSK